MQSPRKKSASELEEHLAAYARDQRVNTKGALALMLAVTRRASARKAPLKADDFLSPQEGQVAGTGKSAVQAILKDHGITRVLAEEGGRTSRGSIRRMRTYVEFLNGLNSEGLLDFARIESWWIDRAREFFESKPLRIKIAPSKSIRHAVKELLEAAFKRQREMPGTTVAGAVMQHLVGAKLAIMLGPAKIEHRGFSVADAPGGRKGDFVVGDAAIHVTTAPTDALIRKCQENLEQNLRPVIITTDRGTGGAGALATDADLADRIDILEIEQFVATNVYELSGFTHAKRPITVRELVDKYNEIIDGCETDPSLKITMGA